MLRSSWWIVVVFGLTACGGGGGSGNGNSNGGGDVDSQPGGSTVPQTPPTLPGIAYRGVAEPADLSAANAGALAEAVRGAFQMPMELADEIKGLSLDAGETINQTQAGPGGGTVQLRGRAQVDGSGWLLTTYTDYQEDGATLNGRQLLETLQLPTSGNGGVAKYRMSFADFHVQASDVDVTYNGSIARDDTGLSDEAVTGSLYVQDSKLKVSLYAQNLNLTRTASSGGAMLALGGSVRTYDSRYGYLDVQSEAPWQFRYPEEYPHHGGALRGVGLGGRYLRLEPLTPSSAAIEFAGAGATQPNYSVRLSWDGDFEEQTTHQAQDAPLADGGSSLTDLPGTLVTLDSRFSSQPQNAFVTSHWQLLFRPPGSNAKLDMADATQPKITMDLPGRYVLRLEVSDGVHTDRDVIALTADPDQSNLFAPVKSQLTADEATTSASLRFDLDRTQYTSFDDPVPQLVLSASGPNDSGPQVSQRDQFATTSLPRPGVYQFTWSSGGPSLGERRILDRKWVAYDMPMPFAPAGTGYLGESGALATAPASGDLNGDGRVDLVVASSDANGARAQVFYNTAEGLLSAPIAIPIQEMNTVAIADVTSDGLPDIVLRQGAGIAVIPQTTVGVFGTQRLLAGGCSSSDPQLAIADLNGDNRLDVVTLGCGGGLNYFLQSSSGQLQPASSVATGTSVQAQFAVDDLNGDGVADVAISDVSDATAPNVFAMYGVRNALPGAPDALPFQATQNQGRAGPVAIGDVNGDGRPDVVTASIPMLNGAAAQVQIFLRGADGSYTAPTNLSAGQLLTKMRIRDLNNDGRNDIAIGIGSYGLTVAYNNGAGSFSPFASDLRPTTGESVAAFPETVADFNGDGLADFAYVVQQRFRKVLAVALGVAD